MTRPAEPRPSRRGFLKLSGAGLVAPVVPAGTGGRGVAAQAGEPDPDLTALELPERAAPGEAFTVHVEFTNVGGEAGPWSSISLSFPRLTSPEDGDRLSIVDEDLLGYSGIATAGDEVTDSSGERVTAEYALVEVGYAEEGKWDAGATHSLTVRVTPETPGEFPVLVRATLTSPGDGEETYTYPEFSSTTDQQGFDAYRRVVRVAEPSTDARTPEAATSPVPATRTEGTQRRGDDAESFERGFLSNEPGGLLGWGSGGNSITVLSIAVTLVSMVLSIVQMSRGQ